MLAAQSGSSALVAEPKNIGHLDRAVFSANRAQFERDIIDVKSIGFKSGIDYDWSKRPYDGAGLNDTYSECLCNAFGVPVVDLAATPESRKVKYFIGPPQRGPSATIAPSDFHSDCVGFDVRTARLPSRVLCYLNPPWPIYEEAWANVLHWQVDHILVVCPKTLFDNLHFEEYLIDNVIRIRHSKHTFMPWLTAPKAAPGWNCTYVALLSANPVRIRAFRSRFGANQLRVRGLEELLSGDVRLHWRASFYDSHGVPLGIPRRNGIRFPPTDDTRPFESEYLSIPAAVAAVVPVPNAGLKCPGCGKFVHGQSYATAPR